MHLHEPAIETATVQTYICPTLPLYGTCQPVRLTTRAGFVIIVGHQYGHTLPLLYIILYTLIKLIGQSELLNITKVRVGSQLNRENRGGGGGILSRKTLGI